MTFKNLNISLKISHAALFYGNGKDRALLGHFLAPYSIIEVNM